MAGPEDHYHHEVLPPDVRFDGGGSNYFRPELLVVGDAEVVAEVNRRLGQEPRGEYDEVAGVTKVPIGPDEDVLAKVAELRSPEPGVRNSAGLPVYVNQVLRGMGHAMPKAGSPPRPATEADAMPLPATVEGSTVRIAVLDSGVDAGAAAGPWLAPFASGPDDFATVTNGTLDRYCGHGTFIAGILRRHAPGAAIEVSHVFDGSGFTDDFTVAQELHALASAGVQVVSLSFGGYTFDNLAPPAMEAAIYALRDVDVAIVAAAGNENTSRPCWPAAFKGVVAVGALDAAGGKACFSNYGSWVNACAEGVDVVSTFVHSGAPAAPVTAPAGCPEVPPAPGGFAGFARWSGTSFAAPRVAAAVAREVTELVGPSRAVFNLLHAGTAHSHPGLGVHVT